MLVIIGVISISNILLNIIINEDIINSLENYVDDFELETLEENLKKYDLTKEEEKTNYIIDKTEYLAAKDRLTIKEYYKKNYVEDYAYDAIYCEVENEVNGNTEEAEKCKIKHNQIIEEIKNNDWKHFAKKDIQELENKIESSSLSEEIVESYKTKRESLLYQLKYNISPVDDRISIINDYNSYKNGLISYKKNEKNLNEEEKKEYASLKENYRINEYKLKNNILYTESGTLMTINNIFNKAGFLVIITIALIAGTIVSEEFNKGTIKQLLIRPYSRSKILLSKLITSFIIFMIILIVYYLVNVLSNVIIGDAKELMMPILKYDFNSDTVYKQSIISSFIISNICILPCYLIIICTSFLISTISKNDSLGIISGIGLYFGGNILNMILSMRNLWINKFVPTLCWNLNDYLTSYMTPKSLLIPIIVDIVTVIILLKVSFIVFKKIDIKNQ